MNVTLTGATGLIGSAIVRALQARGDGVTVLSRDPDKARAALPGVEAHAWRPLDEPAPAAALSGRDAVVHLAGENVAQRWTDEARRGILESRETGTRNLVAGIGAAEPRPRVLVSASAVGYYGSRGDEPVTEDAAAGDDFLAGVCAAWEREAARAAEHGAARGHAAHRRGLDQGGGALAKMLPFFRLGLGGPVAGGRQYLPWIHAEDTVGLYLPRPSTATPGRARSTRPRRRPSPTATSPARWAARCTAPLSRPSPASRCACSTATWPTSSPTGQRAVPTRALERRLPLPPHRPRRALRDTLG